MSNNNNHPLGEAPWFHVVLSTGLGAGFVPVAPGTAGALVALALWWLGYNTLSVDVLFWVTLITTITVTIVGAWTSNVMEKYWGVPTSGRTRRSLLKRNTTPTNLT